MTVVDDFLDDYPRLFGRYDGVAKACARICRDYLGMANVRAIVTSRAKDIGSLEAKIKARNAEFEFASRDDICRRIVDLCGVRVALYLPSDAKRTHEIIRTSVLSNVEEKVFTGKEPRSSDNAYEWRFDGYQAVHFRGEISVLELQTDEFGYNSDRVEIQVVSLFMHGLAEVSHDIIYKPNFGAPSQRVSRIVDRIASHVINIDLALEELTEELNPRSMNNQSIQRESDLSSMLFDIALEHTGNVSELPEIGDTKSLFRYLARNGLLSAVALRESVGTLDASYGGSSIARQVLEDIFLSHPNVFADYISDTASSSTRLGWASSLEASRFLVAAWNALANALQETLSVEVHARALPSVARLIAMLRSAPGFPVDLVLPAERAIRVLAHGAAEGLDASEGEMQDAARLIVSSLKLWAGTSEGQIGSIIHTSITAFLQDNSADHDK